MDRRKFLTAGAAALTSTALASTAFAQSGPLKLGFLIPQSGPAGLFGPSSEACAQIAVDEINARGGILGRQIEAFFGDAGGAPSDTVQSAQRLWRQTGVESLIGQHDSASREAVVGMLRGQLPYIYSPVSEGGFCNDGLFSIGETPAQQLAPSIPYVANAEGAKKWYLIGNDYGWPRATNAAASQIITAAGGEVVGEEYHPFTVSNFDSALARIRDSGAEAVLITFVGGSSVAFNRAFASFGLDQQAVRLGTLIEENTLQGIGAEASGNMYCTAGYFDALDTPGAQAFRKTYYDRYGADAPILNTLGESCYEGARLLEAMANAAGSTEVAALTSVADGVSFTGPRGKIVLNGGFASADIYLAKANGTTYDIVERFGTIDPGTDCRG